MAAIIIIGIIILIVFAVWSKKKAAFVNPHGEKKSEGVILMQDTEQHLFPFSEYKQSLSPILQKEANHNFSQEIGNVAITPPNHSNYYNDDSIIDVTDQFRRINSSNILEKYYDGVPHWKHQYVYSHSEINGASSEQKDFYIIFKNSFLNGKCFDLEGNTNYAFILLFDLLNDYHEHKNIHILENQLKLLGHSYPKTKSYCNSFLIKKMNLIGYSDGVSRIENSNRYDEYYWKLGRKYKEKLNLNKEDVKLLNDLQYSNNSFNEIEFCMIEIIKLYISVCNHLIQTSTSEEKEKYYYGKRIAISCFYDHIFRYCENTIRESYKYRKLHISYDYFKKAKREFGDKIFSKIAVIMPDLIPQIAQPNEETEIRLFTQNTGRWKHFYKEIKKNYNNNSKQFANEVIKLCALNKLNPKGVEEIFFESTIFVLKHDNEIAIKLYFFYLVNVISNNKILTDKRLIALIAKKDLEEAKKLLKNEHPIVSKLYKFNLYLTEKLFTTDEHFNNFCSIFKEYLNNKNIDDAISKIPLIYRKKIELDNKSVSEIKKQHFDTVELLNDYLKEDGDKENTHIGHEIKVIQVNEEIPKDDILFSEIQMNTLNFFENSNFLISQEKFEEFAKSNKILKNQLIDSINELCYEHLDDNLIENDDECYTINQVYYQTILEKWAK